MKKLYIFLIFTLFGFSLNAQNQTEFSLENPSLTLENDDLSLLQNDVQDELPWANRQFRVMAGGFFL